MCGYSSYQDSRLVPPDIGDADEESNVDSFARCAHTLACMRVWMLLKGFGANVDDIADALGCEFCPVWEEE